MKYKVGAVVFSMLGIILVSGTAYSINGGDQGAAAIIPVALLMVGLAIFNIVCVVRSSSTGLVDKVTGKKIRFTPTVKTKGIIADDVHKLWQARFTAVPRIYHYSDLKDIDVIRENSRTTTGNYHSARSSFGSHGYSTRSTTTRMSYISLEIKLVNLQRLRWVPKIGSSDPNRARAEVEDTVELLEYIRSENQKNNR